MPHLDPRGGKVIGRLEKTSLRREYPNSSLKVKLESCWSLRRDRGEGMIAPGLWKREEVTKSKHKSRAMCWGQE